MTQKEEVDAQMARACAHRPVIKDLALKVKNAAATPAEKDTLLVRLAAFVLGE